MNLSLGRQELMIIAVFHYLGLPQFLLRYGEIRSDKHDLRAGSNLPKIIHLDDFVRRSE